MDKFGMDNEEESLTFTKTQVYLILGCIVAIAVLSFSLGHLVSRSTAPVAEEKADKQKVEERMAKVDKMVDEAEAPAKEPEPAPEEPEVVAEEEPPVDVLDDENVEVLSFEPAETAAKVDKPKAPKPKPEAKKEEPTVVAAAIPTKTIVDLPKKEEVKALNKTTDLSKKTVKAQAVTKKPVKKEAVKEEPLSTASVSAPAVTPLPFQAPGASLGGPGGDEPEMKVQEKKREPPKGADVGARFTIQVDTHPTEAEAEEQVSMLKKEGYPAYILELRRTRGSWYRVRIGGFKSREEADKMLVKVRSEMEMPDARVDRYQKP